MWGAARLSVANDGEGEGGGVGADLATHRGQAWEEYGVDCQKITGSGWDLGWVRSIDVRHGKRLDAPALPLDLGPFWRHYREAF